MLHITEDEMRGWFMRCPQCGINLSVSINRGRSFKCIMCGGIIPSAIGLKENVLMRVAWHKSKPQKAGAPLTITNVSMMAHEIF